MQEKENSNDDILLKSWNESINVAYNTEEYLMQEKHLKMVSRGEKLKNDRLKIQISKSLTKRPKLTKHQENKLEIYSELENLFNKLEEQPSNSNLILKRVNQQETLFSYKNFIMIKELKEFTKGTKLLDLKKRKLSDFLIDYNRNRLSSKINNVPFNRSSDVPSHLKGFDCNELKANLLPNIKLNIKNKSKSVIEYKPFFDTEIIVKNNFDRKRSGRGNKIIYPLIDSESGQINYEGKGEKTRKFLSNEKDEKFIFPKINMKIIDPQILPNLEQKN